MSINRSFFVSYSIMYMKSKYVHDRNISFYRYLDGQLERTCTCSIRFYTCCFAKFDAALVRDAARLEADCPQAFVGPNHLFWKKGKNQIKQAVGSDQSACRGVLVRGLGQNACG
jgi:hypothetical protein